VFLNIPVFEVISARKRGRRSVVWEPSDPWRTGMRAGGAVPTGKACWAEEGGALMPISPDLLFEHLALYKEKIAYSRAHELLIGLVGGPWRNRVHAPVVIAASQPCTPLSIDGLRITLDALIVNEDGGKPSDGHFAHKAYDLQQWQTLFLAWEFCKHGEHAIVHRIPPRRR
jgi:hypothetical protein